MKLVRLFLTLSLFIMLLPACGRDDTQNDWRVYHAKPGSLLNPNFPAYSLEYPSAWSMEESASHITFASDGKLLKDVPERLKAGQIIAVLSMNTDLSPEDMITGHTSTLGSVIQFEGITSFIVNGRPAAYQVGRNSETGDQVFVSAMDIGKNTRGLLTARVAEGELDGWKDVLFRIAQSLQVEE
jgi:hypothetical protein